MFESFERFVADADAKVLVLTGAGDRSFCAGADLDELAEAGARVPRAGALPIFGHNFEMPKPSIAAVNGLASGEGFLLAQMCDLCIAAHTATFVLDEAKLGLGAPWAMPLPWLVPPRVAMQMLITGEPVDAHRAREIGLVNEVVSLSDVRTRTQRLGESIAANAPLSVAAARTMLYAVARGAPVNAFDEADRIWETVYTSEDAQEGPTRAPRRAAAAVAGPLTPSPLLRQLADDLRIETDALLRVLEPLDDTSWDMPTPAPGWLVRDQVSHLAYFDVAATTALVDPARFDAEAEVLTTDPEFTDTVARDSRELAPAVLLQWFRDARASLIDEYALADPSVRVPWYGSAMSPATGLTARIMETWAHGQDVVDAVGAERPPTQALRQVAHLGVRAFANSYRTRGRGRTRRAGVRAARRPRWCDLGVGRARGGRPRRGDRGRLLPRRHAAPPPRRRGSHCHRARRVRVDVHRAGLRGARGDGSRVRGSSAEKAS